MKTCWQILEIESTTQIDIIRQLILLAYRCVIPKPIRKGLKHYAAYEEALRLAVNPVEEADDEEKMLPLNMKYYVHSGHYWIQKVIVFSLPHGRNLFSN